MPSGRVSTWVCVCVVGEPGGEVPDAGEGEGGLGMAAAAASSSALMRCSSRARSRWRTLIARSLEGMSEEVDGRTVGTYEVGFHSVAELVVLDYLPSKCRSEGTRRLGCILLYASAKLFRRVQ